jgi:hypothetical protein
MALQGFSGSAQKALGDLLVVGARDHDRDRQLAAVEVGPVFRHDLH